MNVLEELTEFEERIDRAHVERRVEDWEERIDALYRQVDAWLPEGWGSALQDTVPMREALMSKFHLQEHRLPVLDLERDGVRAAQMVPQNLWIIGSNGRVDLVGQSGHYVLNDRSDFFEPPLWRIAKFDRRTDEEPLTAEMLGRILA